MARVRRPTIGEALSSDRIDFDPAFVELCHDYIDREQPGEPMAAKLLYKVLLENRQWRAHVVEVAGHRGELVVRRVQRTECRRRIRKGGLLEFIRGGWGPGVDNREGGVVDGLPVIPGGWAVLEPNNPFIEGKHLDVLTRVLEAVTFKTGEVWDEIAKVTGGEAAVLCNIPPSTMKPVSSDALVVTGPREERRLGDLKVGDLVLTQSGSFQPIEEIADHGPLECLRITLTDGSWCEATADHTFWSRAFGENDFEWRELGKILRGDTVWALGDLIESGPLSDSRFVYRPYPRVASVEPVGPRECRCLRVREDHTFFANRMLVHNSLTVNVFWFAWVWAEIDGGTSRWLFWTYAKELSERDSQRARALVQSEWYAWMYPHIELSRSQNEKHRFDSTRHGVRIATSVEGGGTGEGGNYVVFDDPHKAREAMYSDKVRESTLNAWKSTMTNRQRPPNSGARFGIMQRLHPMDLTGYLLDTGLWYHLVLPMRFNPAHPYLSIFDWRTQEGELLWPAFLPSKKVLQIEAEMGSEEIVAGQHEQLPTAIGGNIFKREWFQPWFAGEDPHFEFVMQSYDTAFTEETRNDPSAMLTFGAFVDVTRKHPDHAPSGRMSVLIREGWQERLAYPDLRTRVQQQFREREYGRGEAKRIMLGEPLIKPPGWDETNGISEWSRGRPPDLALIEEKGSGQALKQDLERAGVPVQGYNPGRMDKIARAHAVSHLVKQRCIYLPAYWVDQAKGRWKFFDWAEALVRELIAFPKYPADHWTDCFTQALAVFRDMSMLRATEDERYDERDDTSQGDDGLVIEHQKAENPYFA